MWGLVLCCKLQTCATLLSIATTVPQNHAKWNNIGIYLMVYIYIYLTLRNYFKHILGWIMWYCRLRYKFCPTCPHSMLLDQSAILFCMKRVGVTPFLQLLLEGHLVSRYGNGEGGWGGGGGEGSYSLLEFRVPIHWLLPSDNFCSVRKVKR